MTVKKKKSTARPAKGSLAPGARLTEAEAQLAFLAPAVIPPAHVRARLLARIRTTSATRPGWRFDSIGAAGGWRDALFPGIRLKTLSVDETRDSALVLLEMAPGSVFPDHVHDAGGAEEGIVISGDVVTGGRLMQAGDFYRADEGTLHAGVVSPHGCMALLSLTARAWKVWRAKVVRA